MEYDPWYYDEGSGCARLEVETAENEDRKAGNRRRDYEVGLNPVHSDLFFFCIAESKRSRGAGNQLPRLRTGVEKFREAFRIAR